CASWGCCQYQSTTKFARTASATTSNATSAQPIPIREGRGRSSMVPFMSGVDPGNIIPKRSAEALSYKRQNKIQGAETAVILPLAVAGRADLTRSTASSDTPAGGWNQRQHAGLTKA